MGSVYISLLRDEDSSQRVDENKFRMFLITHPLPTHTGRGMRWARGGRQKVISEMAANVNIQCFLVFEFFFFFFSFLIPSPLLLSANYAHIFFKSYSGHPPPHMSSLPTTCQKEVKMETRSFVRESCVLDRRGGCSQSLEQVFFEDLLLLLLLLLFSTFINSVIKLAGWLRRRPPLQMGMKVT